MERGGGERQKTSAAFLSGEERDSCGPRVDGRLLTCASSVSMVAGKRPGKRPDWDLKGQLCDLTEELKCYREKTQKLDQENQGLQEQLKEAQEQAAALGTERNTLEGELASVRTQAEQCQQKLEALCARVLELEEWLGTKENLIQELQKEQLELQEERKALATRLEEQEVRARVSLCCLPPGQRPHSSQTPRRLRPQVSSRVSVCAPTASLLPCLWEGTTTVSNDLCPLGPLKYHVTLDSVCLLRDSLHTPQPGARVPSFL